MFSFIYLGFLLLVLGFFAHYIFHRFEEQNHKIKTLGKILTSITTELKDMKENGNKYQEEDEVVDLNENVETDNEVEEVKPTLLETINTNNLCIVSDDDTDYEDDDEEDDDNDDEEDKKDILRCQFMQQSGCGVGVNVGRIDPFTLMSIFAGTGVSSGSTGAFFTTSGSNSVSRNNSVFDSAFDIDENIIENIDEELVEEEEEEEEEEDDEDEDEDKAEETINVLNNVNENVDENVVEKVSNEILNSDYKKMSVEQLRKCVTSKGLTTKVSKLKKMELVELLENNNN